LKSYDLCWLLHLVGDVHQPLHCTTRVSGAPPKEDDGGNGVKLNGTPGDLHTLWDGLLGAGTSINATINAADSLPAGDPALSDDLNTQHWIDESFIAAQTSVYKTPIGLGLGKFTITSAYRAAATSLAKKRVALAGARLAKILNAELK